MAKFYAVKKGRKTGIFTNWEDCEKSVNGFSGAQYKRFNTEKTAREWLMFGDDILYKTMEEVIGVHPPKVYEYQIYTDGSYNSQINHIGYGFVVVFQNSKVIHTQGDDFLDSYGSENIVGEVYGVIEALKWCKYHHIQEVEICHDYIGIKMWATQEWRAKQPISLYYIDQLQTEFRNMDIKFTKVSAHSGVKYNELADRIAKTAVGIS